MGFDAFVTLGVIGVMVVALIAEILEPDAVIFGALGVLLIAGVLTPEEALGGFANRGMLTVGLLFIIAYGVQASGALEVLADRLMGRGAPGRWELIRLMAPVSAMSAFLNNTPIVAMFTPAVREWAERRGVSPSKYLIPLSYAAILGGTCTLIGTSTNLVVNGLLQSRHGVSLGLFDLARVGIPVVIVGLLYMIAVGFNLLPDRRGSEGVVDGHEYVVEMRVVEDGPLVGKTVESAGLRHLKSLFLSEIRRGETVLVAVKPDEVLQGDDRLFFVGVPTGVPQLRSIAGLVPGEEHNWDDIAPTSGPGRLLEAVVSPSSPMLGKTIKEGNFRGRYDAAVLAIRHHGEHVRQGFGGVSLRPGDTLLLLAGPDFRIRWSGTRDFYLISNAAEMPDIDTRKSAFALGPLALLVGLTAFGVMDIFKASVLAVLLLLATRAITVVEARRSLELNVLVVIAASLGLSQALSKSGAAGYLAHHLVEGVAAFGVLGLLAVVYGATSLMTELITNNGAAALMFPVAYGAAVEAGHDPIPFVVAVAIAASASFATPIGYQTNLMVSGPGNYRFTDFLKVGLPLNLLIMVTALIAIRVGWGL